MKKKKKNSLVLLQNPFVFVSDSAIEKNGEKLLNNKKVYEKEIKTVNDDSQFSVEFEVSKDGLKKFKKEKDPILFQLQITYSKNDGSICHRTITKAIDCIFFFPFILFIFFFLSPSFNHFN